MWRLNVPQQDTISWLRLVGEVEVVKWANYKTKKATNQEEFIAPN